MGNKESREKPLNPKDLAIKMSGEVQYAKDLIPYNSETSKILLESTPENGTRILSEMEECLTKQIKGNYCGVASISCSLKYLTGDRTETYSQKNIYEKEMKNGVWGKWYGGMLGLGLDDAITTIRQTNLCTVDKISSLHVEYIAAQLRNNLIDIFHNPTSQEMPKRVIIMNFWRSLGWKKYGHFSPLGGYGKYKREGEEVEYVLILEVAKKGQTHWFPLQKLASLIARPDIVTKQARGLLLLTAN